MATPQTTTTAAPLDTAPIASLLARLGAGLNADDCGPQSVFPPLTADAMAEGFASPLSDLGLLVVTGDERAKFLHSQLTNDVEHLPPGEARWYGYCSPKGRLMSTFLGWSEGDSISLTVSRPLAEPLRKRLSMYVLRTKAKVIDRSADCVLFGVGGAGAAAALSTLGLAAPEPMRVAEADGIAAVGLPPAPAERGPLPRWLLAVPVDAVEAVWTTLRDTLAPAPSTQWRWTEIRAAIPRIVAGTSEAFVPQMLNFELIGGVNFQKGCYPGQEIVARSQYLGKLKRRMFAGHIDGAPPSAGSDVVPVAGGEPAGQVVLAAPSPTGGVDLLFECRIDAVADDALAASGATIRVGALPYALSA